jgi:hypothetical protein
MFFDNNLISQASNVSADGVLNIVIVGGNLSAGSRIPDDHQEKNADRSEDKPAGNERRNRPYFG